MIKELLHRFFKSHTVAFAPEQAARNPYFNITKFNNDIGDVNPSYPIEFIDVLKKLALINPDVSQTIQKISMLGNCGHKVELEGGSRAINAALQELNNLARNAFSHDAGLDGFINQQFRQICITGALCQETVIENQFTGVETVYQVPVKTIRFILNNNRFIPIQQVAGRNIELNPISFIYIPLFTDEDSPYALPPFLAALQYLMRQYEQWQNIDNLMQLWGLMGITWLKVHDGRYFNEAPNEYERRLQLKLQRYFNLFLKNMKKGIAVTGEDVDLSHHNISKAASDVSRIIEATEQQIASGLDIDPAMLGRTYSTTETYATVCYETLLGKIANMQRMIKRANERVYNLHLTMKNIPATAHIIFNDMHSLKYLDKIQAKKIEQEMAIQRRDAGIIDNNTLAHELGYQEAFKKSEETQVILNYNTSRGKYELLKECITIQPIFTQLSKKKHLAIV
ncbi:MAG: hypothetical protein WHV26_03530 [Spirochaetota bacterium]|jgi:hypothetical protein